MNTPKTLIGLLTISLVTLAGSAMALGGTLGGTYGTNVDANAHADYSGVLKAADDAQSQAKGAVDGALATGQGAAAKAQADGQRDAQMSVKASASAENGLLSGITDNLNAFSGWVGQIWAKPTVDAKHVEDADLAGQLASDVSRHDGKLDAYYGQDLESTARADYNIPPPPTPSVGFLGEIKMAFEGIFHLG